MGTRNLKDYENDLYDLLDVKGNKERVNFEDFVAFVGLEKDSSDAHQGCLHDAAEFSKRDPNGAKKRAEDAKFVMRLLLGRGVKVAGLRWELQAAAQAGRSPPGTIQSAAFLGVLGQACDPT